VLGGVVTIDGEIVMKPSHSRDRGSGTIIERVGASCSDDLTKTAMHKYAFHRTLAMFALAALALAALPNGRALAAPQPIYADSLATGWADWSFTISSP
jgi:hypothetical protein